MALGHSKGGEGDFKGREQDHLPCSTSDDARFKTIVRGQGCFAGLPA
jgi:hypothetical protein